MNVLPSFATLDEIEQTLSYDSNTGLLRYCVWSSSHRPGDCAGTISESGYIKVSIGGQSLLGHLVAWFLHHGDWPPQHLHIDHINRVRGDNRIANLRAVDPSTNMLNRGIFKNNSSGFTGISRRGGKWIAQIGYQGQKYHLGTFPTLQEAVGMRAAVKEALA